MRLIITNTTGIPIYIQIKQQIIDAILSGDLSDNEMLPSLRQLSRELTISVLTISRAYTELEQEGFVETIQGKGCYVVPKGSQKVKEKLEAKITEIFKNGIKLSRRINLSSEDVFRIVTKLMEDNSL